MAMLFTSRRFRAIYSGTAAPTFRMISISGLFGKGWFVGHHIPGCILNFTVLFIHICILKGLVWYDLVL